MADKITIAIDGVKVEASPGQTILEAAEQAGIYIPQLCYLKGLEPHGSCRVCTVLVNGRPQAACTQPVSPNMVVENETEALQTIRRDIIDMLFVEGNHFCMFCEKSGNCELQALAYRFGITAPRFEFLFPNKDVDATHPDVMIDHNRCVLCGRCVTASRDVDGKSVFEFVGRGIHKRLAVNSEAQLGGTNLAVTDRAAEVCPVGAIIKKRVGFLVPIGKRKYDHEPIGSEVEDKQMAK